MKFDVAVEIRDRAGKGVARQLRRNGRIPGVLYGQGECLLLTLDPEAIERILQSHAASAALISLNIAGGGSKAVRTALLRDSQVDPITGDVLHVDLFEISMDRAIRVKVPISVIGEVPAGVKDGGVLQHNIRELHIECLPSAIPEHIEVDASQLKITQGIHVRELTPGPGITFLDEGDQMVVSVVAPISEAKLEALLTSGAAVEEGKEPEVIGKGKEEVEEGAEKPAAAGEPKAEKKEVKEAAAGKEPKAEKKEAKEEKKK